jgi:hypothetical protein
VSYDINAGVLSVELPTRPTWWETSLTLLLGLVLTLGVLYVYAVMLPRAIGFETTVLIGLGWLAFRGDFS